MNERRLARLKQQIKQRLAQVLQRDLADPKLGLVTITRIELDTEFTNCKAYWSVLSGTDQDDKARRESAGVLNRARGFCQREMARVLHTRSVPHLEFIFDEGISESIRMQNLLRELNAPKDGEDATKVDSASDDAPHDDAPHEAGADEDAPDEDGASPKQDGDKPAE